MERLNNADGLVNLPAMVDQLAAKGLLEDKSIPIVLGEAPTASEATLLLIAILSSGVHWMGQSIIRCRQLLGGH